LKSCATNREQAREKNRSGDWRKDIPGDFFYWGEGRANCEKPTGKKGERSAVNYREEEQDICTGKLGTVPAFLKVKAYIRNRQVDINDGPPKTREQRYIKKGWVYGGYKASKRTKNM